MSGYRDRFEKEINRVGVSRIAQTLGIARNTVYNWMANGNAPLNQLLALEGMGIDIVYVLTGKLRAQQNESHQVNQSAQPYGLSADEAALLKTYREIDPEARITLQNMLRLVAGAGQVAGQVAEQPAAEVPAKPRQRPACMAHVQIRDGNLPDKKFTPPKTKPSGGKKKKDSAA